MTMRSSQWSSTIFSGELGGAVTDEKDARGHARILPENKKARDLWSREPVLGPLTSTKGHSNRHCLENLCFSMPYDALTSAKEHPRRVCFATHRVPKLTFKSLTSAMERPT